jgi:hypothetical protein
MLWPCVNQRYMHTKSPFMCGTHSHHVYSSTNTVICTCLHEPKKQSSNPHAYHALNSCTSAHSLGCLVTMACKLIVHDKMKCTHYCYFQGLWHCNEASGILWKPPIIIKNSQFVYSQSSWWLCPIFCSHTCYTKNHFYTMKWLFLAVLLQVKDFRSQNTNLIQVWLISIQNWIVKFVHNWF